jgi:hypothetical protein
MIALNIHFHPCGNELLIAAVSRYSKTNSLGAETEVVETKRGFEQAIRFCLLLRQAGMIKIGIIIRYPGTGFS